MLFRSVEYGIDKKLLKILKNELDIDNEDLFKINGPLDLTVLMIKIATQRKDLALVYSFSGDLLFLSKQEGLGQAIPGGNKKQNPKWLNLVDRMKEDG